MSAFSPKEAANSRYRSLFDLENKKVPKIEERKHNHLATSEPLPTRKHRFLNEVRKITMLNSRVYFSPEFNCENFANNSTSSLRSINYMEIEGKFANQAKYRVHQEREPIQVLNRAMKVVHETNRKLGIIRDSERRR